MRTIVFSLVVALLVVAPATASESGSYRDPEEQPFCEGPGECPDTDYMDFKRATFGHGGKPTRLRHGIFTYKRWKSKWLGGKHGTTIAIEFNTDDDARLERELRIRKKNGRLRARMYRNPPFFEKRVEGRIRVWRPNGRSAKVAFHVNLLGSDVDSYRWQVSWYDRGLHCAGSCQNDYAPNSGAYRHNL